MEWTVTIFQSPEKASQIRGSAENIGVIVNEIMANPEFKGTLVSVSAHEQAPQKETAGIICYELKGKLHKHLVTADVCVGNFIVETISRLNAEGATVMAAMTMRNALLSVAGPSIVA